MGERLARMRAIGSISGTSMDGIDVAIIETDGREKVSPGPGRTYPYPSELRRRLLELTADVGRLTTEPLTRLDEEVTDAHTEAIRTFLTDLKLGRGEVDLVGLHGQTIYHRPEERLTRQLGIGKRAAAMLGIDTVDRFRHNDVAAGGQGAPLAPLYHWALARCLPQPLMVLNLGGVGNVTYLDGKTIIAFDTGPANALIDDFIWRRLGKPFDEDGRLAASGIVDKLMLARLMDNPFFARKPPKSLDRNDFHARASIVAPLNDANGAATLAAFTVAAAAAALDHVPARPKRWLVTGGGRRNTYFMRNLAERLGTPVEAVEAVGWNGDFIEAQLFGYLAVRCVHGLPLSLPTTTGVARPMPGGELHRAA
jgi:anhydro-N-acetylmuramic acid kinase